MSEVHIREVREDGWLFAYRLQKPYDIPDEEGEKFLSREQLRDLPEAPDYVGEGANWEQIIVLPGMDSRYPRVVFMFESFLETGLGPNEHKIYGPFRPRT